MIRLNSPKLEAILTGKDIVVSTQRLKSINHFDQEDVIYCINNLLKRVAELEDTLSEVQRSVGSLEGLHHYD